MEQSAIVVEERPARSALTRTGGFLAGFSHTLQPYIGCRFGCSYCYVRQSNVHRFFSGGHEWGAYVYPRTGIAQRLEAELARLEKNGKLAQTAIFMSSSTDPYQPAERTHRLSRGCLQAFGHRPPGLLVIQTRSPLAAQDFGLMQRLGEACLLNVTVETDREDVRRRVTPLCPSVSQRLELLAAARRAGVPVQATVSPCLPYSDVETFGGLLLDACDRVVVDSFVSGDGGGGKRTRCTQIPALYADAGWGDWQAEEAALALYDWLRQRIGPRAGWSQDGFTRQARQVTGAAIGPATAPATDRSNNF